MTTVSGTERGTQLLGDLGNLAVTLSAAWGC
jgi:hypothetical protein